MKRWCRMILGLWMAMLLLMSLAGTGLAFPSEGRRGEGDQGFGTIPAPVFSQMADMAQHGNGPPVLISIVRSDRGFALGPDDEILPFRLQVEKVRGIDPSQVRRLLGENRTLGEIKAEILGDDRAYNYRGSMRLGWAHYVLDNLNITSEDTNSTLEADVMEPVWGMIPAASEPGLEMVGRISIETRLQDGFGIGVGSLVIFSGQYAGSYAILLDSATGAGCDMESCPAWVGDLASFAAGPEVQEIRSHTDRRSFSAWVGTGSPIPFWEVVSHGPGLATISTSFGRGCDAGVCPFKLDPSFDLSLIVPCNLVGGEPDPEGLDHPGRHGEGDLARCAPEDLSRWIQPVYSEI